MREIRSLKSSASDAVGAHHSAPQALEAKLPPPPPHGGGDRFQIEVFDVLTSTNDSILQAGERGAPEGTTHISRSQTKGRGRGDHSWWSPPGAGLWMSTLLSPSRRREEWGGISLVAGRAVRDALLAIGVRAIELFWPNDLQVGRKKIGGILGEARAQGNRAWIALGIGVNIDFGGEARRHMPPELKGLVTSLVECGAPSITDPVALGRHILETFGPLYERFLSGESIPDLVGEGLAHVGRGVEILAPGQAPRGGWKGRVEGLGSRGELLVRPESSDQLVAVSGGEVIYEDPSK